MQLLAIECSHNEDLERKIQEKDGLATKLRNESREMLAREQDLKAELSTIRNTSNYLLYQKQITENNLKQLEKQLDQKCQRLEEITQNNQKFENDIENLSKEKFDANHYVKELDILLQRENDRNLKMQKDISNIVKEILLYAQDLNDLKAREKAMESDMKNLQAEVRNLNSKINALDRVRTKQESDMYEIESNLEKLKQRVKKMAGETTSEDEKRQIEIERSRLLTILDKKKKSLHMLTEELKIMMDKINVAIKDLEANKRENSKLTEKIKYFDFYISNSQKTLKCCISRKEELLVQECLIKFQMKRYQKLLNDRNKSVISLKKSKTEFEIMMKDRTEELKNCNDLLDAEIRTEEEERRMVKRRFQECDDKVLKLQSKYKILLDALGVSEPGESAEAEMLIKAEEEKKDLQYERDKLITVVLKNEEELTALKNTLWLIDAANEQFRQALYPPGIS
ncbi:Coiled-coil domain-containing protein 39, partial [Stegodyphus mimosarum]